MRHSHVWLGIAAFTAVLSSSADATAHCRATSCASNGVCASDCGVPLSWAGPCVGYSVQRDGSRQAPFDLAHEVFARAFDAWTGAACDAGVVALRAFDMGAVACRRSEFNPSGGNSNVILFRDDAWPHGDGDHTLGLTTVTFETETGSIDDADIEINAATVLLTADGSGGFDLDSIALHEVGHFLGMAHSSAPGAVMDPGIGPGETKRTLSSDDVAGICAIYGGAPAPPDACAYAPVGGFATDCGAVDDGASFWQRACCGSTAPSTTGGGAHGAAGAAGAALAMLLARRRRRGRCRLSTTRSATSSPPPWGARRG